MKYTISKSDKLSGSLEGKQLTFSSDPEDFDEPLFYHIFKQQLLNASNGDEDKSREAFEKAKEILAGGSSITVLDLMFEIQK